MLKKMIIMLQMLSLSLFGCAKGAEQEKLLVRMEARVYKNSEYSHPLPYRLFIPDGYAATNRYPLVLVLHHGGARGTDNKAQIVHEVIRLIDPAVQGKFPSFILAPQCPKQSQWLNTNFKSKPFVNYRQEEIPESDAMKMAIQVIHDLQREFAIDENRLYVMGTSMGSSGTWDIITRYPQLFAAAITMTGVSDPATAHRIAHLPIWSFHGRKDDISSVDTTRNMIRELRKHGSQCRYTEFDHVGHSITGVAFKEPHLIEWLFSQSKKASSP